MGLTMRVSSRQFKQEFALLTPACLVMAPCCLKSPPPSPESLPKKRWLLLLLQFILPKVMLSLAKEVTSKRNNLHNTKFFQSTSSTITLNIIEPCPLQQHHVDSEIIHSSFSYSHDNQLRLTESVQNKDLEALAGLDSFAPHVVNQVGNESQGNYNAKV
ncbi:Calcium-transporting ATPase 12, plasma membrane-type [Senna tora]|uniref:Calcium-transporting ATPase 12, plasma membrane-type n=1 Tax=Senna tora TaxID=362788 RepID=A0A834TQQ7_9FABA|nr:Calcium-transporting ATPase 12, plasma membrane-type [Senna tora]